MTPWEIHAIEVSNCNCAYGCPCQFNALPTTGTCEAAVGYKIQKGNYGGVSLDGLSAGMTAKWPGPIHEGNGERQIIIDDKATAEQKDALEKILSGEEEEVQPAGLGAVVEEDEGEDVVLPHDLDHVNGTGKINKTTEDDGECEACTI